MGALSGAAIEADFSKQGRNLSYNVAYSSIDPGFHTNSGFLPRVDLQQTSGTVSYRWWPESNLMTWGPSATYLRLYDHGGVLQDEQLQGMASFSFRNNMAITGMVNRDLERYGQIDFRKTGYGFFGVMSARILSIYGGYNWGDGILYADDPYLGRSTIGNVNFRFQPTSRLRTEFNMVSSDFVNPLDGAGIFHVKIFRTRTTYQFTDRLLARHIAEHNTQSVTVGNNVLITYRINAGTVLFLGYDDRYQQGNRIDSLLFPFSALQRTNRRSSGSCRTCSATEPHLKNLSRPSTRSRGSGHDGRDRRVIRRRPGAHHPRTTRFPRGRPRLQRGGQAAARRPGGPRGRPRGFVPRRRRPHDGGCRHRQIRPGAGRRGGLAAGDARGALERGAARRVVVGGSRPPRAGGDQRTGADRRSPPCTSWSRGAVCRRPCSRTRTGRTASTDPSCCCCSWASSPGSSTPLPRRWRPSRGCGRT